MTDHHLQNITMPFGAVIPIEEDDGKPPYQHLDEKNPGGWRSNCRASCCGIYDLTPVIAITICICLIGLVMLPLAGLGLAKVARSLGGNTFDVITSLPRPDNYTGEYLDTAEMRALGNQIIDMNRTLHDRFASFESENSALTSKTMSPKEKLSFKNYTDVKDKYFYQYNLHQTSAQEGKDEGINLFKHVDHYFYGLIIADVVVCLIFVAIGFFVTLNLAKTFVFILLSAAAGFGLMYLIATQQLYDETLHDNVTKAVEDMQRHFGQYMN